MKIGKGSILAIGIVIMLAMIAVAVGVGISTFTATPTPLAEVDELEPTLIHGNTVESAAFVVGVAVDDECVDKPFVIDSRPDGHSSLSVLPRLGQGDFDVLQAFYNFTMLDQYGCRRAQPGELYWDIYALHFECGAANIHPQVYDLNGQLITDRGILLFLNWHGAEQFPVTVDPPYAQSGAAGFTEGGDLAWAYGGESHIGPDGGPYMVWASSDPETWTDRVVGSDAIADLGWWDDHCEPSPMFRITRKAGVAPPTPSDYALIDYDEHGQPTGYYIPFLGGSPPSGEKILGLMIDGEDMGYIEWMR